MSSLWGHKVILYSFRMKASDKGSGVICALIWKKNSTLDGLAIYII